MKTVTGTARKPSIQARQLAFCALFTALTAVGAFIQVPIPYTDYFTLQFLFVILAGMLLGAKRGAIALAVYVAVGLCGFPVFAAGGGLHYIFRPTFGYLLGFIAAAALTGLVCEKLRARRFRHFFAAALVGYAVTYAIGFTYKYMILNVYLGQPTPWAVVILSAFPLDMPGDLVLCVCASALAGRLKTALEKEKLL